MYLVSHMMLLPFVLVQFFVLSTNMAKAFWVFCTLVLPSSKHFVTKLFTHLESLLVSSPVLTACGLQEEGLPLKLSLSRCWVGYLI